MASRKRGNGDGSITQRPDGRWEARITLLSGKRHSHYEATYEQARKWLTAALRDRDQGLQLVSDRQTVAAYLASWLVTIKHHVKPRTWLRYEGAIRLHVGPRLGRIALSRLTPQQLQALYDAKLEESLSHGTVQHLHAVMHHALKDAYRLGLVPRNVANLVTAPRAEKHEMAVLAPDQVRTLLAAARGERLEALFVLAVTTGMRQGEMLGLHWRDVDLEAKTLHVRCTLHYIPRGNSQEQCECDAGRWRLDTPKSKRSDRHVALSDVVIEALRAHRARQLVERLAMGPTWHDHDFVFTRADGEPWRGQHVYQRQFLPLLTRAGLPAVRFHDLRHSAVTLALALGNPAHAVAEQVGHSDVSMTWNTYAHVLPGMRAEIAASMDRLLKAEQGNG